MAAYTGKAEAWKIIGGFVDLLQRPDSPNAPPPAAIWKWRVGEPDLHGILRNASATHLGCIDIIRLDDQQNLNTLDFVPFAELRGAIFTEHDLTPYALHTAQDSR